MVKKFSLKNLLLNINEIAGKNIAPVHKDFRKGDINNSLADISKTSLLLGYQPVFPKKALKLMMSKFDCHIDLFLI